MKPKNIFAFFFILMFLMQFQSCNKVQYHIFQSYINTYKKPEDIDFNVKKSGIIEFRSGLIKKNYSWISEGNDKIVYDSLCHAHNDISYNKKRDYIAYPHWGEASTLCINGINIISNTDFDQNHPAGASLNNIVRLVSYSPKKFIDSGYIDTFDWKYDTPESFEGLYDFVNIEEMKNFHPIDKQLAELYFDDMKMLPPYVFGYLVFDSNPADSKEHELTITISLCDGSNIEKTLVKVFD
jgi:hypothetical protein